MPASSSTPLVSVCVPAYNGARWLRECIESAIAQTYRNLEILIVDDVSKDDTVEVARSFADERVRVVVNPFNRGLVGNWNECVRLARGEFVKFLFQDDVLYPTCVERMVEMFRQHPRLGLVFSPRDVIVESDVDAEFGRMWLEYSGTLHTRYRVAPGVNDGRELFAQHVRQKFLHCCVGEPTTVLIRKECFERVGLFNPLVRQTCDIEMWLRIMYFYDIGFIEEKLSAFRFHAGSASSENIKNLNYLFDLIWTLEGLLSYEEIRANEPEVVRLREEQLARNSLVRPPDGWRSLLSAAGRAAALEEAALIPRRAKFLTAYYIRRLRVAAGRAQVRELL